MSNLVAHAIKVGADARVDAAHPTRDPRVLAWLDERRAAAAEAGCDEAETRQRYLSLHSIGCGGLAAVAAPKWDEST